MSKAINIKVETIDRSKPDYGHDITPSHALLCQMGPAARIPKVVGFYWDPSFMDTALDSEASCAIEITLDNGDTWMFEKAPSVEIAAVVFATFAELMAYESSSECEHPDHEFGKTCLERSVGCSKTCNCCMDIVGGALEAMGWSKL